MAAYSAYRMGFEVAILEKEKNSPAGQLTHHEHVGWVDDEDVLKRFAQDCNVITLENEFVDAQRLAFLEKLGKTVIPSSATISLIQDKFIQKQTMNQVRVPTAAFVAIASEKDYEKVQKQLGTPFVLKSRKIGYDGYGNALIHNKEEFKTHFPRLAGRHPHLMAEQYIPFQMELAVMVARTPAEIKTYPVVQTIQQNHICHTVLVPAPIDEGLLKQAQQLAVRCVEAVQGYGLYGIELFLGPKNEILVNEMAPRPHNSGHYTMEACKTSQFENFVRAVLGLPLGSTEMVKPHAVMINLLGKREGPGSIENWKDALSHDGVHVHVYGKKTSRVGRKMGHITMIGKDLNELLLRAKEIHEKVVI